METKFLYSIYDSRGKMFMDPFVAFNDNIALRDFQRNCMDPNSPLVVFSEDYSLMCLGTFNIVGGFIDGQPDGPVTICKASAFKKSE